MVRVMIILGAVALGVALILLIQKSAVPEPMPVRPLEYSSPGGPGKVIGTSAIGHGGPARSGAGRLQDSRQPADQAASGIP